MAGSVSKRLMVNELNLCPGVCYRDCITIATVTSSDCIISATGVWPPPSCLAVE